ncbi:MAG: hypothetical protein NC388_01790 [Clostridium sp.]|nr:hypothetical protein [Clostridium sp.]
MSLVWKLLRQHISIGQLAGFFLANLVGMLIVLLGWQFYRDVTPVFTQGDSFIKSDFVVVSKKVSAAGLLGGTVHGFSEDELDELGRQPFCKGVGAFTGSRYKVGAGMSIEGVASFTTEMFFESVPDDYVDVESRDWHYEPGDKLIPIILPRSYLTLYNFGFAQSRSLPKLSEGVIGLITMDIYVRGNGRQDIYEGKVVGFSNRLNTILVPESFMQWSNETYAPDVPVDPVRLIMEVDNPADDRIARYVKDKGYEIEDDKLEAGRTTYFLRVVSGVVMGIGLTISILSFYILMLSIYLLVQKNTVKLQNLLLIGYSPMQVSLPYQLLTVGMNLLVLLLALGLLSAVRDLYMTMLTALFPKMNDEGMWTAAGIGLLLFVAVSLLNVWAVRRKVSNIWRNKE